MLHELTAHQRHVLGELAARRDRLEERKLTSLGKTIRARTIELSAVAKITEVATQRRLIALLDKKAGGAFNFAGDGTMTWRESAEILGTKTRKMSFKTATAIAKLSWLLRLPRTEAPPGNLHFIRYPWVVSNEKLKSETGCTVMVALVSRQKAPSTTLRK